MGNLSIRCQMGRSMMLRYLLSANGVHSKTPRAGVRTSSRRSSASMSCSWLFLGGLVSTRAHLRFTNRRTACDTRLLPVEHVSANGNRCLIRLSQPRGPLQTDQFLHYRREEEEERKRVDSRTPHPSLRYTCQRLLIGCRSSCGVGRARIDVFQPIGGSVLRFRQFLGRHRPG